MNISLADAVQVVAVLLALWAAYEARRAANASKAAVEGQIIYDCIREYFQPPMADALRTLRAWKEAHGDGFAQAWLAEFRAVPRSEESKKVDLARRHVKGYFDRAVRLKSAELIDDRAFKEMVYVNGIELYYDIVVPLELALNPKWRTRSLETLQQKIGRYQHGTPLV